MKAFLNVVGKLVVERNLDKVCYPATCRKYKFKMKLAYMGYLKMCSI